MNRKKPIYIITTIAVTLLWSQQTFSADAPPTKPEPNKWKVHLLSIPLALTHYFTLTWLFVPLTVKTNNFFRSKAPLSPTLAFFGLVTAERFLSQIFVDWLAKRTELFSKDELTQAQRNAMAYATLFYMTPDSLKNRIASIYPALKRLFFKKTKDGLSVKSFEQTQELVPVIKAFNKNIQAKFGQIITLEAKGENDAMSKNFDQFKEVAAEFGTLLVNREIQREKLYENYNIEQLSQLRNVAQQLVNDAQSKTVNVLEFTKDFEALKELYTKVQGGILGIVGEALKYFEGS
jgi:hypothetical protein